MTQTGFFFSAGSRAGLGDKTDPALQQLARMVDRQLLPHEPHTVCPKCWERVHASKLDPTSFYCDTHGPIGWGVPCCEGPDKQEGVK